MDEKLEIGARVVKVDEPLGLVFGWAICCTKGGKPYYDLQDEHIPEYVMMAAAADFMDGERTAGEMHTVDGDGNAVKAGSVVFMFPLSADVAKAMSIEGDQTGLMIASRPTPEVLAKFKSGEYTGFSIGGMVSREDAE